MFQRHLDIFALSKTAVSHCFHFVESIKQRHWAAHWGKLDLLHTHSLYPGSLGLEFSQTVNNQRSSRTTLQVYQALECVPIQTGLPVLALSSMNTWTFYPLQREGEQVSGFSINGFSTSLQVLRGRAVLYSPCKPRSWHSARQEKTLD